MNEQLIASPGLVQVPAEKYQKLISTEISYNLLLKGVLNGMKLNYRGDELECDDDRIIAVLELIALDECESRLDELKKKKAQHDAEIEELRKREEL